MTKKKNKTVNLWKNLCLKLKEMKKIGISISDTVDICLNTETDLNKLLEREGVEIELDILNGMKIINLSLPEKTLQKIDKIKEAISSFSGSVVTNLCLIFPSLTVDSILQKIKAKYFLEKHPEDKKEGENEELEELEELAKIGEPEELGKIEELEEIRELREPIPEHILERVHEIGKNYK